MPGALAATTKDAPAGKAKAKPAPKSRPTVKRVKEEAESEEDAPPPKKKAKASAAPKKRVKAESDVDASEEDDAPLAKKKGKAPPKKKVKAEEDEEDVKPAKGKKGKAKKEDDEGEEQVFRWWEISDAQGDGSDKWQTLVHSGVLFPPLYETLPKNVKMKYDGPCMFTLSPISLNTPQVRRSTSRLSLRRSLASTPHSWRPTTLRTQHSTRISLTTGRRSSPSTLPYVCSSSPPLPR
jgi:hypothetical protein